jgi:hypothetical protein
VAEPANEPADDWALTDEPADVTDGLRAPVESAEQVAEGGAAEVREVSMVEASERTDSTERGRVPTHDETRRDVERAQAALAEIAASQQADAARESEEAAR